MAVIRSFSGFLPFWELSGAERSKSEGVLCQVFPTCRSKSRNGRKVFQTNKLVDGLQEGSVHGTRKLPCAIATVSFAPSGLGLPRLEPPGLAPWAAFLRRFAADNMRAGPPQIRSWVLAHTLAALNLPPLRGLRRFVSPSATAPRLGYRFVRRVSKNVFESLVSSLFAGRAPLGRHLAEPRR